MSPGLLQLSNGTAPTGTGTHRPWSPDRELRSAPTNTPPQQQPHRSEQAHGHEETISTAPASRPPHGAIKPAPAEPGILQRSRSDAPPDSKSSPRLLLQFLLLFFQRLFHVLLDVFEAFFHLLLQKFPGLFVLHVLGEHAEDFMMITSLAPSGHGKSILVILASKRVELASSTVFWPGTYSTYIDFPLFYPFP